MSQVPSRTLRPEDNFTRSLNKGTQSELEFMKLCPLPLIHTANKTTPDFYLAEADLKLELKCDDKISPNMYIEFQSSYGTPGGVYQSQKMGADIFIYWCRRENTTYYFWVHELIARVEQLKDQLQVVRAYSHDDNGNEWFNAGYLLPKITVSEIRLKRTGSITNPFTKHKIIVAS